MEKKNYIVAVDLGSSNVVVMVGAKGEDGKVHIVDVAVKEVQGMLRGEIKNIEGVAKSIREAVDELENRLSIRISEAYTGISGQHIKCAKNSYYVYVGRDGEIREEDVQKLNDSMRNVQAPEGEKILHIIPQNYIVNDEEEVADPVGMFGQKLEATFNFVIGDSSAVSRLEKALMKVGIRQTQMFLNPLVSAEAVVLPDEKELGVAVVDIGAGTTDICIYHDKIARHVSVVPLGADIINKDIRSYGILERYVEDLKVKYGSALSEQASADKIIKVPGRTPRDPKEISFKNLAAIIEARMQDIMDYVMMEIKQAGYENKLAAGLVLTGGGSQLRDLDQMVKNYTGLDVRIAVPDVNVDEESMEMAADSRLSTAVGILMKGLENGRTGGVESIRRISTASAAGEARPATNPVRSGVQVPPVAAEAAPEKEVAPEAEEKGKKKKEKRNPFSKLFKNITDMFDVVDDNEI